VSSLSLSLSKLKKISSFSFSLHYSFSFPPLLFLLGDSLWKGLFEGHKESMFNCRSQIYLSANRAFFDEMLIMFLAAARKTFSNLKKIVVFSTYFPVPFWIHLRFLLLGALDHDMYNNPTHISWSIPHSFLHVLRMVRIGYGLYLPFLLFDSSFFCFDTV
jgi:hypothetical protein